MKYMKAMLAMVLALSLSLGGGVAFAGGIYENGVNRGQFTDIDFTNGPTITGASRKIVDFALFVQSPVAAGAATAVWGIANGFRAEGATANSFETDFVFADATADQTVTVPNYAVNYALVGSTLVTNAISAANSLWFASNGLVMEGATADAFETTITPTDPTADRTVTLPDASGTVPLFQASFSASKMYVATDAVASGQTSKAVTVTGITTAAKCVASLAEVATNSVSVRAVVPTANTATVTLSGDPGASDADLSVICAE